VIVQVVQECVRAKGLYRSTAAAGIFKYFSPALRLKPGSTPSISGAGEVFWTAGSRLFGSVQLLSDCGAHAEEFNNQLAVFGGNAS
jgi:hypothetical protein